MTEENLNTMELNLVCKVQPTHLDEQKNEAVYVRHAHKHFGRKKSPVVVLNDLNMTVQKGIIYGLLGASGCGKTTLLNCIVGRKNFDSGELWVLGGPPGSRTSGVPGPRIGFMPQQVALYNEFTVRESMRFFGWLAGMNAKQIGARLDFLVELLALPDVDEKIKNLSGGQQRRVSFAAALLHEPELLILDEPTVGLDPILRETIWKHLVHITQNGNTTVILTTHYIDETRQADKIALIRGGYILAEESPDSLLVQLGVATLEDAFLKLSVRQSKGDGSGRFGYESESVVLDNTNDLPEPSDSTRFSLMAKLDNVPQSSYRQTLAGSYKTFHMKALIWKNLLWMLKNLPLMCSISLTPVLTIVLFCFTIGHNPVGLSVAVVNYETNYRKCDVITCNQTTLGCAYLGYLKREGFSLIYYESEMEAIDSVVHGNSYASLVIRHNFSDALRNRIEEARDVKDWDLTYSTIDVFRDLSVKDISAFIKVRLHHSFGDFIGDYMESCNVNRQTTTLPIRWNKPIYGIQYPEFTDFAAPGVLITLIFFSSVALTAGAALIERNEGILERSLVMGVSSTEIILAHAICEFGVMIIKVLLTLAVAFTAFDLTLKGSNFLLTILTIIISVCGMSAGFAVSFGCENETVAAYVLMGSFWPSVILSGIIWPIEAMHYILQTIASLLPLTLATECMRSILQRGWNLTEPVVYKGFISLGVWTLIFWIVVAGFLKSSKR